METAYDPAEHLVKDGDALSFDSMTFQVISTPGHTPGSVCYQIADMLFTGDTLFFLSIGRTDFPGGNYDDMMQSLAKLAQIEENLKVYPGHEQSSSLDYEKDNNPFMP